MNRKSILSDVISKLHKQQTRVSDDEQELDEEEADQKSEARNEHNELRKLLDQANLIAYLDAFVEQGGDDVAQLCDADDAEFREICDLVGMSVKPLHVRRLRKALDERKAAAAAMETASVQTGIKLVSTLGKNSLNYVYFFLKLKQIP